MAKKKKPSNDNREGQGNGILARKPGEGDEAYAKRVAARDRTRKFREERKGMSAGQLQATTLRKYAERIASNHEKVKTWPAHAKVDLAAVCVDMANAAKLLVLAADKLAKLPKDYTPKVVRTAKGVELEPGTLVVLREKKRPTYAGIAGMLENLKVVVYNKPMVQVETAAGTFMFIPRAHVQRKEEFEAEAEEAKAS